MKRRPLSTKRQKRKLVLPKHRNRPNTKVSKEGWLECAKVALIEDGIEGVKVERLAKRLKVSRGGFYYFFKSHGQLLDELISLWKVQNRFTPSKVHVTNPEAAAKVLSQITDNLVHETEFDPQFDMAMREWARIAHPVAETMEEVDGQRIDVLQEVFKGLGYDSKEALIRARIFYWHQIGYYATGFQETLSEREANVPIYVGVLVGEKYRRYSDPR